MIKLMSKVILVVFILMTANACFSQVLENPYEKALELHLTEIREFDRSLTTLYIQYDRHVKDLPDTVAGICIKVISGEVIKEMTKKKKKIELTVVEPIQWEDNSLHISIAHFHVSRKRSHYQFASEYSSKVMLDYNCELLVYQFTMSP